MKTEKFKFKFRERVEDRLTQYIGKITARVEYENGDISYLVESIDSTGRPVEEWIREDRLKEY